VQDRLSALLEARLADAQAQVAEQVAFTARLQRAAAHARQHRLEGPCGERCGCGAEAPTAAEATAGVPLVAAWSGQEPLVCTLSSADLEATGRTRIAEWQAVAARALRRERVEGGVRLVLPRSLDVGPVAELAAAEQTCCSFFRFGLGIGPDHVTLDVTGPEEALPVIEAFVGAAA
jgi:hypothetical protein